jgi:predicted Ser/Thr protein kinase
LLLERVQDDQWRRLGARGGQPVAVKADLGPEIGRGGEGVVYTSLDGKSVYKDLGPTRLTSVEGYVDMEVVNLNKYYGEGFAEVLIEDGRKYIKMGKIDGVDLAHVEKGSLPAEARSLLDDAVAQMEARDIFHNDPQLSNFMYSKTDNKLYPIDMNGMPAEFMVPAVKNVYDRQITQLRSAFSELIAQ